MSQPTPTPVPSVVSADVALHCDDELGRPMAFMATLCFDPADPFAVDLTLHLPDGDVPWQVGRTLLHEGLARGVGEGAVRAHPDVDEEGHAVVRLELCSLIGRLRVAVRSVELLDFLSRTWRAVPPGTESQRYDLDALVAVLLG